MAVQVEMIYEDISVFGRPHAVHRLYQGRLSRPRRPEQTDKLVWLYRKRNAIEHLDPGTSSTLDLAADVHHIDPHFGACVVNTDVPRLIDPNHESTYLDVVCRAYNLTRNAGAV